MADLTMCPRVPAATLAGVSCPSANERFLVPERPIIVFDVNETLLDLEAIRPVFDRIFNDPVAMRLWFAGRSHAERRTPPAPAGRTPVLRATPRSGSRDPRSPCVSFPSGASLAVPARLHIVRSAIRCGIRLPPGGRARAVTECGT